MAKHVALGATGNVGGAVARKLLNSGEGVIAVVRDQSKAAGLREAGAVIVAVDISDAEALRDVLRQGDRAFLLNPPAPPDTDTNAEEPRTVASTLSATDLST